MLVRVVYVEEKAISRFRVCRIDNGIDLESDLLLADIAIDPDYLSIKTTLFRVLIILLESNVVPAAEVFRVDLDGRGQCDSHVASFFINGWQDQGHCHLSDLADCQSLYVEILDRNICRLLHFDDEAALCHVYYLSHRSQCCQDEAI